MKKVLKIASPVLVLLFLFAALGCEKEDEFSKEELLTAHTWRFSDMTADTDTQDILDLITFVKALMTGGTLSFDDDGTYSMTAMQQTDTGTWELSSDEKTLIMDKGTADESETTLVSLTLTKMVWEDEGDYQ
ncbi:MAG: lipocalin family protein, partial [Bacteroidota bacterium]|nr:lipocalin family protein [Bacteroidota bacterium]